MMSDYASPVAAPAQIGMSVSSGRDVPPVMQSAAHLDAAIDGLHNTLNNLDERLRPILSQPVPEPENIVGKLDDARSDHAQHLEQLACRIDTAIDRVHRMLSRLEV